MNRIFRNRGRMGAWMCLSVLMLQCSSPAETGFPDPVLFTMPPAQYKANAALGMMLNDVNEEKAREGVRYYHERGFGGVAVVPNRGNKGDLPDWYVEQGGSFMHLVDSGMVYLDENYIKVYRAYLDEAEKLGMRAILYDDYNFPTGQVAGQFFQHFPEHMAARLDKVEMDISGKGSVQLELPEGTYLGAALWNLNSNETTDVSDRYKDGKVSCELGEGKWKLMAFYLNHQNVLELRNPGIMNYIEKEAVEKFISISYEKFYKGFGDYFGNVIPMTFYDEPSLHWMDGRMWSASLNARYEEKYGESPLKYYPALWYDIGPSTAAARNAILGVRAEMYEINFVKQLADWCEAHGFWLSGHMDQEERPNPVMANGDLMKVFKYQQVPGADDVFWWGRMNPGYKLVTSSSYNYDKPLTWAETFAAYQENDIHIAYKVTMDQYAMGINMQIPATGRLERMLSVEEFKEFNNYVGRLSYLLQGGRHVSDIAVLYPIASAQAYNTFGEGWEYAYLGGEMPPEFDYLEVGEELFRRLRIDFTYLHPEVLTEKCLVEDQVLVLDNKINREEYKVLIIPGGATIQLSTAQKILEFYRRGGKILATSKLPVHSAEFGKDALVQEAMKEIFGDGQNRNEAGGMACFLQHAETAALKEALEICLPNKDVEFAEKMWDTGQLSKYRKGLKLDSKEWMQMQRPDYHGALTYTHKVKEGKDLYFFANSSDTHLDSEVWIRGKKSLSAWDPHTGDRSALEYRSVPRNGEEGTAFLLNLPTCRSLFVISD